MNARTLYRRLFRASQVDCGRVTVELHFDPAHSRAKMLVLSTRQHRERARRRSIKPGVEAQLEEIRALEPVLKSVEVYPGVIMLLVKVFGSWRSWRMYGPTVKAITRAAEQLGARIRITSAFEQWGVNRG